MFISFFLDEDGIENTIVLDTGDGTARDQNTIVLEAGDGTASDENTIVLDTGDGTAQPGQQFVLLATADEDGTIRLGDLQSINLQNIKLISGGMIVLSFENFIIISSYIKSLLCI